MGVGKSEAVDGFFDLGGVAARDGEGLLAVLDDELHGTGPGNNLLDLLQVDEEGTVAAHNHGVGTQVFLNLLGGGAQHVVADLTIVPLIDFHIVADGLDVEEVGNMERDTLAGSAREGNRLGGCRFVFLLRCCWRILLAGAGCQGGCGALLGFLLETLQLLVEQARLLQLGTEEPAAELETPIQTDGEGAEGDDEQGLKEVAPREHVARYQVAHRKMAVQADEQCHQRGVDQLEPQVAADDVIDTLIIGAGHFDDILERGIGHRTTHKAQQPHRQQMDIASPLPSLQTEGFEDGQGEHREDGADDAGHNRIFLSLAHTADKGTINVPILDLYSSQLCTLSHFCCHSSHKPAEYPKNLL